MCKYYIYHHACMHACRTDHVHPEVSDVLCVCVGQI